MTNAGDQLQSAACVARLVAKRRSGALRTEGSGRHGSGLLMALSTWASSRLLLRRQDGRVPPGLAALAHESREDSVV